MKNEKDLASTPSIEFNELSADATEFLHELNDPNLLKNREIPSSAKLELRKHQVARLRATIEVLGAKRDEFVRRMEEYIGNLHQLVGELEKNVDVEASDQPDPVSGDPCSLTRVQCLHCSTERSFDKLKVIFARESEESFAQPTELYVLQAGALKKGHFVCNTCGTQNLVIKAS